VIVGKGKLGFIPLLDSMIRLRTQDQEQSSGGNATREREEVCAPDQLSSPPPSDLKRCERISSQIVHRGGPNKESRVRRAHELL
jgi:hypothetical protein